MVIAEFNIFCSVFMPTEADAPLVIDPNAMPTHPVPFQCFQAVARWGAEVQQIDRLVNHQQFAPGRIGDIYRGALRTEASKYPDGPFVRKAPYHGKAYRMPLRPVKRYANAYAALWASNSRSRISDAALGTWVPGPKMAETPAVLRKS